MSKHKSSQNVRVSKENERAWTAAIAGAQRMIKEGETRISELRHSIEIFEEMRKNGTAFPKRLTGAKPRRTRVQRAGTAS